MRNLLLIVLLMGFIACNQTPDYKISVSIASANGKAYLSNRINGEWVKLDSAKIHKGAAKFRGHVENPDICYLTVSNSTQKLPFFIENSDILILGTLDSLSVAKVTGSATQDEYQQLQTKMDELDKKATALFDQSKELEKAGNKAKADSLLAQSDAIFTSIDNQQKEYIKANPASWISPYLLSRVYYDMESDVLDGFLKGLDPKLDSVPSVLTLKERVNKLKTVAVGQTAPDFTMNDVDGNPVKLSDVYSKNEYTLIDFWASWCGPCRHENPNVVATFNKYKDKGFNVMGVSLDNDSEKWKKAIADDQLTWTHVSDLQKWKNQAAALYVVNSIPSNLLVDKTGKIIGRNLREEKLRETIAGLLK
ncbi:MAG: redoxin domain-containing protein [Methylococcaceae bacterium]|nr:TlpA disulfide reductase family protein [Prolixibacteraceae bacterium]